VHAEARQTHRCRSADRPTESSPPDRESARVGSGDRDRGGAAARADLRT
jgi:hypothetical protein